MPQSPGHTQKTESKTSCWWDLVTPTGVLLGSQHFSPKGWKGKYDSCN